MASIESSRFYFQKQFFFVESSLDPFCCQNEFSTCCNFDGGGEKKTGVLKLMFLINVRFTSEWAGDMKQFQNSNILPGVFINHI